MLGNLQSGPPRDQSGGRRIRLGGFTLVELLVAVAILAILTVAAAPSMTRIIARYRLNTAADELVTLMRYGQSEAKMRGATVTLSISGDELQVSYGTTTAAAGTTPSTTALRQMNLSSRLVLNPSPSLATGSISFLANGQIRPSNQASGRLDDKSKGMLLLCSTSLANDQNAVVIRFSGAELRRQEHGAGSACNTFPP